MIFPLFIFSQKIDSAYVYDINDKARVLERNGSFTQAYDLINDLVIKLEGQKDSRFIASFYQTKAGIEQKLGKYKQSIKTSKQSLQLDIQLKDSSGIAYCYNLIGIAYYFLSNFDSTKVYYEKSYTLKKKINTSHEKLAVSAYNLGILYEDLAQTEKALKFYLDAEYYLLKSKMTKSFLSDIYVGIAHLYFYKKEINKAEEYSEKAMDVGLKSYGEFNPNMTFVYNFYANILVSKKKYKEAINLLRKSLKIRQETYGEFHKWTCESNYKLATVLVDDEQLNEAEALFKKAIAIGEKIKSSQYLANAKIQLSKLYLDQNIKLIEVEKLLLSALNQNINVFGYKNDVTAENYYYLAQLAKKKDQKEKFFAFITQTFNSSSYQKNNLNQVVAPFQALDAIVLAGDWYTEAYNKSNDLDFLIKKFELIDQEVALIKFSQRNFTSDYSQIHFANEYRIVFEKGLNTCWRLYNKTNDQKYLEKAFALSETNRNTTLLKGLQDTQYKLYGDIPKDLIAHEKNVKQDLELVKLDLYYEKTAKTPDKIFISELLNARILHSNRLDSLHKIFKTNYPRYADLKYNNKQIEIKDVQINLDEDTQLITYFLGSKNLFAFHITKEKITFLKNEIALDLIEKTEKLKNNLIARNTIHEISKNLYQSLLANHLNKPQNILIIIPDNVLNYIPFEILINDENKYLIEDFTISYTGSVNLFMELKNDFFKYESPNYWAGFSPNYKQNYKLSSNQNEVTTIAKIVNGKKFIGDLSNKKSFLENNKEYSILHLALHAKIDNENPMFNKLLFNDEELSAAEIYLSKNKANLAVLSACNTGFGKLEKGEGIMSMARAFHFSGVPSVIMSLWKVPDKETKKIMVSFYKHLEKGETKSLALKNAKLDYLSTTQDINLKHPYYWSGFVLNGNTEPLKNKKKYYYLISGGLVLFSLLIWRRKSKLNKRY
ncbi:MAG: CHAT domain-containing protein [Flavobacteriaceae bacterium]|nr:CHAT domain-containing protein [Flavobacteriaceae bacterium]